MYTSGRHIQAYEEGDQEQVAGPLPCYQLPVDALPCRRHPQSQDIPYHSPPEEIHQRLQVSNV